MKVYEFANFNELLQSSNSVVENVLICRSFPSFMAVLITECEMPITAVKRFSHALKNDKRFAPYLPFIESKIKSGEYNFTDGIFSLLFKKIDDGYFYISLNI